MCGMAKWQRNASASLLYTYFEAGEFTVINIEQTSFKDIVHNFETLHWVALSQDFC